MTTRPTAETTHEDGSNQPSFSPAPPATSAGASYVVCAWSDLKDVILGRQTVLPDAAVRAGVPRFISPDYSADYTRTAPGHNRNFDLRLLRAA